MSTLTFILDASVTNGSLTLNNDGTFIYTPNTNYNGTDSFTFHVYDGAYNSSIARADITVSPINDSPRGNTGSYTAVGNSVSSSGNVLTGSLSGNDIDGDILSFTMSTLPSHGVMTLTPTGYFSYTPALGYTGSDSFIFITSDGSATATGLMNITVQDNGVPPVVIFDRFTIVSPLTVYAGTPFGVTIQARDINNNILS
jgi:large repetitive protein